MGCFRCFRCIRRRQNGESSHNDRDESSEDSEMFWMRRRREESHREKEKHRTEFLENVLITKKIVAVDQRMGVTEVEDFEEMTRTDGSDTSCAICLTDYDIGDSVSYSHNPMCAHCFHRECIISWLKSHDGCPCCRQDFLAFGDDEADEIANTTRPDLREANSHRDSGLSSAMREGDLESGGRSSQLDRLYGTGAFNFNEDSTTSSSTVLGHANDEEPWEIRLEQTMDRLRRQVEEQIQTARSQLQERRERRERTERSEEYSGDEGRIERSIQLLRTQFSRVREVANREIQNRRDRRSVSETSSQSAGRHDRDDRIEDAIEVVRSRLHDIANSDGAQLIRERSVRTVQALVRHAARLRK